MESDSDSSQGDLIDFDESVQSRKEGFGINNNNRGTVHNPPKNLFRYDKKDSDIQVTEEQF